jgi:hypothetical protein
MIFVSFHLLIWLPSQNGLFSDLPHLQRVTRFRISYCMPSDDSIGMPPRTQSGPCSLRGGYSMMTMDFSNSGSIAFPLSLSLITSQPDGQLYASSMAMSRASWSSDCSTRPPSPGSKNERLPGTKRSGGPTISWSSSCASRDQRS